MIEKAEIDIIREGYEKGFKDANRGRTYNKIDNGGWNIIDAWSYRDGYRYGYKKGLETREKENSGNIEDIIEKYFYIDFKNEINIQAEIALNLGLPAVGSKV